MAGPANVSSDDGRGCEPAAPSGARLGFNFHFLPPTSHCRVWIAVQVAAGDDIPFALSRLIMESWRHDASSRPTMQSVLDTLSGIIADVA